MLDSYLEKKEDRLGQLSPMMVKDCELLGTVLGRTDQAQIILADYPKESLVDMGIERLTQIEGITKAKAKVLAAAFELARRGLHKGLGDKPLITSPADCLPFFIDIRTTMREHFVVLYLNARNQVIHREVVSIGSLSSAIVHPREVFRTAVSQAAASIIAAHNHPSGDVSPSQDDINLTRRLVQAGEVIGIEVLDHLIVSRDDFLSMKERGLM